LVVAPIVGEASQADGTAAASPTEAVAAITGSSPSPSSDPPVILYFLAVAGLGGAAALAVWKLPGIIAARR
jgi:hypothetical protein